LLAAVGRAIDGGGCAAASVCSAAAKARREAARRDSQEATEFPSDAFQQLANVVKPGNYAGFDDPRGTPSAISRVGAFTPPEDYRTTVVMASGDWRGILGSFIPWAIVVAIMMVLP